MTVEETIENLIQLRLPHMASALRAELDRAAGSALTVEDCVGLMVDREWTERDNRRTGRRIKDAKLEIKVNGAAVKENDKELVAFTKEHASEAKRLTKEADALAKKLATFEAQKSALVNDTSVAPSAAKPAPDGVVKRTRRTKAEMEAARAAAA